jgi:hypothetical protein
MSIGLYIAPGIMRMKIEDIWILLLQNYFTPSKNYNGLAGPGNLSTDRVLARGATTIYVREAGREETELERPRKRVLDTA